MQSAGYLVPVRWCCDALTCALLAPAAQYNGLHCGLQLRVAGAAPVRTRYRRQTCRQHAAPSALSPVPTCRSMGACLSGCLAHRLLFPPSRWQGPALPVSGRHHGVQSLRRPEDKRAKASWEQQSTMHAHKPLTLMLVAWPACTSSIELSSISYTCGHT